jgi:fucose permease
MEPGGNEKDFVTISQTVHVPGMKSALLAFLCYCGFEFSAGLWSASYLVEQKKLFSSTAAAWTSIYYGSITVGRLFCGFFANRFSARKLIRLSCFLSLAGVACLFAKPQFFSLIGLTIIGCGNAPFYPTTIHETSARFGERYSQAAVGLQIACAYIGSTFIPSIAGLLAKYFSLKIYPWFLLLLLILIIFFSEQLERTINPCTRRTS